MMVLRAPFRALGWLLVGLIRGYQLTIGRLLPDRCRFHPSCSSYALAAIRLNGPVIGAGQAVWRVLRCAPWSDGGIDEPRRIHLLHRHPQGWQELEDSTMGSHG